MKKNILLLAAWFMACLTVSAQKSFVGYAIGFYNQENLFDTCHDEGKNDYEYLPAKGWNGLKYSNKLKNMAQVLSEMGTDVIPVGCAAIGLAEVENDNVLKDLVAQPALAKRGFNFVHIEGPDRRGIDCALLYNPQLFQVRNVKLVPYVQELKKDSAFYTRGFLTVSGTLANEHVAIIVCHLPSRFSASFYRESGARQIKVVKDSLLREDPTCKVIVMGDMNDDPEDASMYKELAAKENINKVKADEMFNPWYNVHQSGTGTLSYQGAWNLFDQIIISENLLSPDGVNDYSSLKFRKNEIYLRDFLITQEGKTKGAPKRTFASGVWLNGYSDHLPTQIFLVKEVN